VTPALAVDDLRVARGGEPVLDGVSLTAATGAVVGLIGPNGAGKTTLLRACNGSLDPDAGTIRIDGDRLSGLSARATARRVATVPQGTDASFAFTVRETVAMGRYAHVSRLGRHGPDDRAAVETAMERAAVADLADRSVARISGGERSRVLLARALAQDAPLLLLDEPTASLDIGHQVRTLSLVRGLAADGRTVLAAIHDLDLAARFCDRLVLLADGRVRTAGPPETVLDGPALRAAYDVRTRVGPDPATASPRVTALVDGTERRAGTDGQTGRVHVLGGDGRAGRHLGPLVAAGHAVTVGPVATTDPDADAAATLGAEAVTLPPHAPVDDATAARVRDLIAAADATLVPDVPVAEGSLPALAAAATADRLVVATDRPLDDRNHAGEAGRTAWARLTGRGRVVPAARAVDAVGTAVEAARGARTAPDRDGGSDSDRDRDRARSAPD
jgi:iron complex transport system ATP-binding protein